MVNSTPNTSRCSRVLIIVFVGVLIYVTPLFVCKPLTSDTVMYDLQAKSVLDGGVAYRDIFEPNLPGAIWVHMAVRSVIGPSSEAIRLLDLAILGLNLWLLSFWLKHSGISTNARLITATALLLFYVSMSEWCHCQRDSWMLLPALCGLLLRWQHHAKRDKSSLKQIEFRGVIEGVIWAFAFWMKPFTAVAGLGCLTVSAVAAGNRRPLIRDFVGVLKGGFLVGLIGIVWLMATGAWPWLLHTITEWNPEYFSTGKQRWTLQRFEFMHYRFYPWLLLHVVALPVAAAQLLNWFRHQRTDHSAIRPAMFNAFYLSWTFQSFAFQHLMDYIHVPGVLLATTTIVGSREWTIPLAVRRFAVVAFLWVAVFQSHLMQPHMASNWLSCLSQGSTAENRGVLSEANFPNWNEMEPVIDYLKTQNLQDGELTCFNVHTIHIYDRLGLKPSTRYVGLSSLITLFPSRQSQLAEALLKSRQRFIVTELVESGLRVAEATDQGSESNALPPAFPPIEQQTFPWSHPVVFRSGRYLVHRVLPELGVIVGRIPGR